MRQGVKKGLKITGLILGSIFILLLILPFVFKDRIILLVKHEANKALQVKLDFDKLDISFISHFPKATIELKNFSLAGVGEFSKDTLVSADGIDIAVNILSFFGDKEMEINHVILDKPIINAIKLADGKVNWNIMKPDTTTTADTATAPSSFALKLEKLEIRNGSIRYTDDSTQMRFQTDALDLKLSGDMSAKSTEMVCKMNSRDIYFVQGNIPYLKNAEFEMDIKLNADLEHNKFTISENKLQLNAIEINLDGWFALLDPGFDMDITLNTPGIEFKDVLSLIPAIYQNNFASLKTKGSLDFKAEAKGKMIDKLLPRFLVTLQVKNGMINYEGMPKAIENVFVNASVSNPGGSADNTIIQIENLSFSMIGNPFKMTLYASNPLTDMNFKATAAGKINLNQIREIYPLGDSTQLTGIITSNLEFAGKLSDIEKERYENIRGEGDFTISEMNLKTKNYPALSIKKIAASISPKIMTLRELDIKIGKNDIQANGNLSNYIPYFLKNEVLKGSLAVNSSYLNLNDFMGSDTSEPPTKQKENTTPSTVLEIPENLDLSLKANLKKVIFQQMTLENINGTMSVSNGTIRMNPLSLNAFGGSVLSTGSYSTAKNKLKPNVDFSLDIRQASFVKTFKELDIVQKMIPIFEKTGGDYSVKVDMSATLDNEMNPNLNSITAKGVLQSENINIQNMEVFNQLATLLKNDKLKNIQAKNIRIPFSIKNGIVTTSPFDLKLGGINVNLSGTTSLNQQINYTAKIDIPAEMTGGYVNNINAMIGGTFSKPTIKLNTKEVAEKAAQQIITQAVTSKLLGVSPDASKEEQIAALRKAAEENGNKLVELAEKEGQKLVDGAKNLVTKIAAQAAAKQLVSEAKKQAQALKDEAEKQIQKLEN